MARWVMREGLLGKFSLAKEQMDWAEGRRIEDGEGGEAVDDTGSLKEG